MTAPSKGIYVNTASRKSKSKLREDDTFGNLSTQMWYYHYNNIWKALELKLKKLNKEISMKLVNDIINFIQNYEHIETSIPAVTLYTGTNLSDHDTLFRTITAEIRKELSCPVVLLHPSQGTSTKYLLACMINSFITGKNVNPTSDEFQSEDESVQTKKSANKLVYTMSHLHEWYEESVIRGSKTSKRPNLIIVIPDIESFSSSVLQMFLKSISVFKNRLPLMLVFGVATSFQDIPDRLSHEVLPRYTLHVFQSQSPLVFLNRVLEEVFLNSNCPFQLGNKVFDFLTMMFLYYNFSVERFIRGIKFCLMNHFFDSDINILCCRVEKISDMVKNLTKAQLNEIARLPSVLKYKRRKSIQMDSVLGYKDVEKLLNELHEHLSAFHVAVRCLHAMSNSLPKSPLGTHIREIYSMSVSSDITKTEEYKNCFDILHHLSKDDLLAKVDTLIDILSKNSSVGQLADAQQKFQQFLVDIEKSDLMKLIETSHSSPSAPDTPTSKPKDNTGTPSNRTEFLKNLQNRSQPKELTEFEKVKRDFLSFLSGEFFKNFLKPSSEFPLSEILVYNQVEVIRNCFDGALPAALHKAMVDPHSYLQCDCCKTKNRNEIVDTFPDLCVAYKLHLECGTEINLYDWLQSFVYKVEDNDAMECDCVNPRIHARFLQAVKDLQYLGFIAPSRRKTDHVKKLKF